MTVGPVATANASPTTSAAFDYCKSVSALTDKYDHQPVVYASAKARCQANQEWYTESTREDNPDGRQRWRAVTSVRYMTFYGEWRTERVYGSNLYA